MAANRRGPSRPQAVGHIARALSTRSAQKDPKLRGGETMRTEPGLAGGTQDPFIHRAQLQWTHRYNSQRREELLDGVHSCCEVAVLALVQPPPQRLRRLQAVLMLARGALFHL